MPNTYYTDYTDYRVVYIISEVNVSVGYTQLSSIASNLAVGTSTKSAHTIKESKKVKKPTKKDTSMTDIWKTPASINQPLTQKNLQDTVALNVILY